MMPTVLESLNSALHRAFAADERVLLLGEDVLDPYGGAFKVTRGLSTAYPERVLTTPVSEAGIVGVAAGMALRGLRPVVEIMFGDFTTLIADQLINHIAKFRWMYNDQVRLPLVIRAPMGGRRGYGPTHSQTLEKLYLGVPGLRILAPSALGDPGGLLYDSILKTEDPILFIENKLLYATRLHGDALADDYQINADVSRLENNAGLLAPVYSLSIAGSPPASLTMAAYGYMAELAIQAVRKLAYEHEVFADLIVPTEISSFNLTPLTELLGRTGRLLTIEEGTYTLGWGAEITARAAETLGAKLEATRRVAALDLPLPASIPMEAAVLPGVEKIIRAGVAIAR